MKIEKFNDGIEYIDEQILVVLDLVSEKNLLESLFKKKGSFYNISFLFAEIDDETLSNILKMKKFINSLKFYISCFHDNGNYAIDVEFILNAPQLDVLKNKIKMLLNTKKYNL